MGLGRSHARAQNDEKDARRDIKKDQDAGRKPAKGDIEKKGQAITTQADIKAARKQK